MATADEAETIVFENAAAWESWLAENHSHQAGVWLKLAKKNSGIPSVTDDEVVDIGLCYGWISGQRKSFDEHYYLQKYAPRRLRSLWSQVNVDKVADLEAAGRMREPGWAEVRAAQADGRWAAAYVSQKNATVPSDVITSLAEVPEAKRIFDALSKTDQYRLYLPIIQATNQKVRVARMAKMIAALTEPVTTD